MRYAFIGSDGTVVQVITGLLTPEQQTMFLRDYSILFGAIDVIEIEPNISVWIGGAYTDGVFTEPLQPEPLPEILPEPEVAEPEI